MRKINIFTDLKASTCTQSADVWHKFGTTFAVLSWSP